jgi:hypothetical protein
MFWLVMWLLMRFVPRGYVPWWRQQRPCLFGFSATRHLTTVAKDVDSMCTVPLQAAVCPFIKRRCFHCHKNTRIASEGYDA